MVARGPKRHGAAYGVRDAAMSAERRSRLAARVIGSCIGRIVVGERERAPEASYAEYGAAVSRSLGFRPRAPGTASGALSLAIVGAKPSERG